MTTSATLPSATGPVHAGGFSAISEEGVGEAVFETPRPIKRCLIGPPLSDSCKKRRKQATPVRISAADSDLVSPEGKLPVVASPEPDAFRCPLCQLAFNKSERLQNHIATEHANVECKKEPPEDVVPSSIPPPNYERSETPIELPVASRSDVSWRNDLQNNEWINPNLHGMPFSPATPLFMTLPSFAQPDNIPARQPVRIFNPDAYCDLCNKEFCNKYFLKTHKANKHGIYSDPPASESVATSVNIPSFSTNIKIPTNSNSNNSNPSTSDNTPCTKTDQNNKSQANAANPFGDIFQNNPNLFANKLFSKINKPGVQGLFDSDVPETITTVPDFNTPSILCNGGQTDRNVGVDETTTDETLSPKVIQHDPVLFKNEFNFDDGTFFTPPSKMSPSQHHQSQQLQNRELDVHRLKRIGVMNPKAFCEICCKEYCNKYFLRTHKMKRHGIYIPDEGKDKDSRNELNWSHNMQTSPLNLIMAEQNNSNMSERKTTSPSEIGCDLCGIKFQNASLAQLHNVSVHSRINQTGHELSDVCAEEIQNNIVPESNGVEKSSADAISEDLQKLQTMILQLNDLDVNRAANTCGICSKEFENRYYLHAHMMAEHSLLVEEGSEMEKNDESDAGANIVNNNVCDICNKEVSDDIKKHIMEAHPNHQMEQLKDESFGNVEKGVIRGNTSGIQFSDRRSSMNMTPSSSYCEICNKELCNKYFMKTHMQRMHGIEIENGAQIGGVICDICNKELCSKYFLRVHKHNTHGIVEYGSSLLQPRKNDVEPTPMLPTEQDSALKPGDLADLSHRYFTHFTEVCTICSRRFRSTKWLKTHLLTDHGQAGAEKWAELEQQLQQTMSQNCKTPAKTPQSERSSPTLKIPNGNNNQENVTSKLGIQNVLSSIFGTDENNTPKSYNCSYCPFSTPVLPFLFIHERSHMIPSTESDGTSLKCPVCSQTFAQGEQLQHHLFTQHPFLPLPPFFNGNGENQTTETGMVGVEASSDGVEDEESASSPSESGRQLPRGIGSRKIKRKESRVELSSEVGRSLKEVANKSQLPATYALPHIGEESEMAASGYVMQAFLVDEPASERRFVPSVVFLPVLQKQSAPINVTFTLTPA